jgi:hypothetical protein
VIDWVVKHENIIDLPIFNETLLIKGPGSNQTTQVGKLLLDIPVRELHNKIVSAVIDGRLANAGNLIEKVTVSNTTLRLIIKRDIPQLHRASFGHKQMCECVTCTTAYMLQNLLNGFQLHKLFGFSVMSTMIGLLERTKMLRKGYMDNTKFLYSQKTSIGTKTLARP